MALGGGDFTTYTKNLPGAYVVTISAARSGDAIPERGYCAIPLEFDWGIDGAIFEVAAKQFYSDAQKIFGYTYDNDKMKGLRDLYKNAQVVYFYKLNSDGVKATNTFATAKYGGVRGNDFTIVIENGVDSGTFDVQTFLGTVKVDSQIVTTAAGLVSNDYLDFKTGATLATTAGLPLSTGTNGTIANTDYQAFLDKIESYSYNTLGTVSNDSDIKGLFAEFTKRLRDEQGIKFQCVLHKYATADYEGIISVENNTLTDLVYWTLGACANCAINSSVTNKTYDGEYTVDTDYTQTELEAAIGVGKFIFHNVMNEVRVLLDINTLTTYTTTKNDEFKYNQTIRIIDQIANNSASIFNNDYLGKIPNDDAGKLSLKNALLDMFLDLQVQRAITGFVADALTIGGVDTDKRAVVVDVSVTILNTMTKLYMTVVIS